MPQSRCNGWSTPNVASNEDGWSASCARSSVWIAGLGIDFTFTILVPTSQGGFTNHQRKSGHKKPGLNKQFGRDHIVPGLFSELFNVAASRPAQMTTEWLKLIPSLLFVKTSLGLTKAPTADGKQNAQRFLCFHKPSDLSMRPANG